MKKSITLNAGLTVAALMLLTLCAGYAIGYWRGVHDDQRLWWASVQFDHGKRVFLGRPAVAIADLPTAVQRNAPAARLDK